MCGFAGILLSPQYKNNNHHSEISSLVDQMNSSISHRGPDSQDVYINQDVAFCHSRLSIVDLSEAGSQPMMIDFDSPVIVFNGEIYNFLDLKKYLSSKFSIVWKSTSDTEVVLQLYVKLGLEGLKLLEGIFAFAIWDPKLNQLILIRDRLGIKPLYYSETNYGFAFASEIKAVLLTKNNKELNIQSISEYMWFGNTFEERTIYNEIFSLLPGNCIVIKDGQKKIFPWWKIEDWLEETSFSNYNDVAKKLQAKLDFSVERQLVSDVPIGMFLSGGIDSSAIAASISNNSKINSYAAAFDFDKGVNELSKAAKVAEHLSLNHHEIKINGTNLEETLILLAKIHDDPFADAANIPLYLMCNELKGKIKVVLQGDGGDELFAGYNRYTILDQLNYWKLFPTYFSEIIISFNDFGRRFIRIADAINQPTDSMRMALLLTMESLRERPEKIFNIEYQNYLQNETNPFLAYINAGDRFKNQNPVNQMLLTDLTVQLPSQFLVKVDRSTMAAGVEARVPLLDDSIVKFAINLPSNFKIKGNDRKIILKNVLRRRLPSSILDAPKVGFGVPYEYWLRTSLYNFALTHVLDNGFITFFNLDHRIIEKYFIEHKTQKNKSRGFLLWKLFQLSLFYNYNLK